jgi:hypothetical protein
MAHRRTDTNKWEDLWFRRLPPKMKYLWLYMTDSCNYAGVWPVDLELAKFKTGIEELEIEEINTHFADKIVWLNNDHILIPEFLAYQYKHGCVPSNLKININNKLSEYDLSLDVILSKPKFLEWVQSRALSGSSQIRNKKLEVRNKEQEVRKKEEEIKREKEAEVGLYEIKELVEVWSDTLKAYNILKDPRIDEMAIFNLVRLHGHEMTKAALIGVRFEPKTQNFDPSRYVRISRLMKADMFDKFLNLGLQYQSKTQTKEPTTHDCEIPI